MNLIRLFVPFTSLPPPSGSGYQARRRGGRAAMAGHHPSPMGEPASGRRTPPLTAQVASSSSSSSSHFLRFLAIFKPFLQLEENRPSRSHTPLNLSVIWYWITRPSMHKLGPRDLEMVPKFGNLAFGSDLQEGGRTSYMEVPYKHGAIGKGRFHR